MATRLLVGPLRTLEASSDVTMRFRRPFQNPSGLDVALVLQHLLFRSKMAKSPASNGAARPVERNVAHVCNPALHAITAYASTSAVIQLIKPVPLLLWLQRLTSRRIQPEPVRIQALLCNPTRFPYLNHQRRRLLSPPPPSLNQISSLPQYIVVSMLLPMTAAIWTVASPTTAFGKNNGDG